MAKAKSKAKAPVSLPLTLVVPVDPFGFLEVMAIDEFGREVETGCQNPTHASSRIPGLDAEGCSKCRRWWFDQRYRLTIKEEKATGQKRLGKRKAVG